MHADIARCPSCRAALEVSELVCPSCELVLRGRFPRGCRFCSLDPDQRHLLEVFLSCRGTLRDMERVLGVSYPTVRSRLDALLAALGYPRERPETRPPEDLTAERQQILARLEAGEISPEETAEALRRLSSTHTPEEGKP